MLFCSRCELEYAMVDKKNTGGDDEKEQNSDVNLTKNSRFSTQLPLLLKSYSVHNW